MTSKLETVLSRDARVDTNYAGNPTYVVHKSGITYTGYRYSTQSATMSSIQFTCNPSSSNVFVSRKVMLSVPLRITLNAPRVAGTGGAQILQQEAFGMRFMPLSNAIASLQATVNGQNTSILLSDVIQPLMSFNTSKLKQDYLTMTPNTFDLSQTYSTLRGSVRSNLANIKDNIHSSECQRGAFPMNIVRNDAIAEGDTATAIIDVVLTEPLFVSPFRCDVDDTCGFYNVTTMNININFVGSSALAAKLLSYLPTYADPNVWLPTNSDITIELGSNVVGYSFPKNSSPELLFDYISPSQFQVIPPILHYDYYDVQKHNSSLQNIPPATYDRRAGLRTNKFIVPQEIPFTGPNIQVASVPSYIVLYVRRADKDKRVYTPDTYLPIRSVSLQVGNNTTLLASCTKRQLYKIAKENGCEFTWAEWSGEPCVDDPLPANAGVGPTYVCGQGSILKLRFGKDIQLDNESLASGSNALLMIQANVICENWQPAIVYARVGEDDLFMPETLAYDAALYMLVVSEGIFAITGSNSASSALGVLQQSNVIDTITQSNVSEYDVVDKEGGSFATTLKKGWQKAIPYIKKYGPEVAKGALKGAVEALGVVGLGGELMSNDNDRQNYHSNFLSGGVSAGMNAGMSAGGRMLPRRELKKRLAKGY